MANIPLGNERGAWKVSACGKGHSWFMIHRKAKTKQGAVAFAQWLNKQERNWILGAAAPLRQLADSGGP